MGGPGGGSPPGKTIFVFFWPFKKLLQKVLTIKSSKITPQAEAFIKTLSEGGTLKIEVVYIDPLKKIRRVNKDFFL